VQTDAREPLVAGSDHAGPRLRVFVHLAADKDAAAWRRAWQAGTLVGVNEETPYGYGRAERMGCTLAFSRACPEKPAARLLRLGLRALAGFDLLHALRQGSVLSEADVVWTHTESQFLAVAAAHAFRARRPKLIGQSIWLFDRWERLNPLHRMLYRRLIRNVDALMVHSTENLAVARALFPGKRVLYVPFGIPAECVTAPVRRPARPLRILAVGSDRHRDWACLAAALDGLPEASAVILSGTAPRRLARGRPNLRVGPARTNAELAAHLAAASVVCVPLKPNRHASGITVIQEAVLAGLPVVATATGGLESYFGADAVRYVPPGDAAALRAALIEVARNPEAARARAERAQARMTEASIGAESYIRRHVEISREMLDR
jgi:glycosyltransferase involved in cell wall biosynthesis